MAGIYSKDIGKAPEPVMADPSTLVRAAQLQAGAISGAIKGGVKAHEAYMESEFEKAQKQGEALQQEFFVSNQGAQVAAEQYGALEQGREAVVSPYLGSSMPEEQEYANKLLKPFDDKMNKLKLASEGGMTPSEYTTRVTNITREWIAKHPEYADDIRKKMGQATGMEGADLWAQRKFVKKQFEEKTGTDHTAAIIKADVTAIADVGIMSAEEAFKMRTTNPGQYAIARQRAYDMKALDARHKQVQATISAAQAQTGFDADTFMNVAIDSFKGGFELALGQQMTNDIDKSLASTSELLARGNMDVVDPVKFKVLSDQHTARISGLADQNYMTASAQMEQYITKNNVPLDKANAMRTTLQKQRDDYKKMYGTESSLALMAAIHVGYRDKTLKEQQDVFNMSYQLLQGIPKDQVTMYLQGGAAREDLKRRASDVHDMLETHLKAAAGAGANVIGTINAGRDLAGVKAVVTQANTGDVVVGAADATPPQVKAGHQAMQHLTTVALDKSDLKPTEKTLIKSTFATNTALGANSETLRGDYVRLQAAIKKQPVEVQNDIKAGVANGTARGLVSLRDVKSVIEQKYGVKLEMGVDSGGNIMPLMPKLYGAEAAKYNEAVKEFMRQSKPTLSNMVLGRVMVTEEDRFAVGSELVSVLNGKTEYKPFYSDKPMPVEDKKPADRNVIPVDVQQERDKDALLIMEAELKKAEAAGDTESVAALKREIERMKK